METQNIYRVIWEIYSQIILFFINYYKTFFKVKEIQKPEIKQKNILTEYIEYNTDKFMHSFTKNSNVLSSNIDPIFYSKTAFKEEIQAENNNIEPVWKRRILFETTPRGNIIMYYDAYKQGFAYYTDTTGIPYSLLNVVAMKYVTTFLCRDFFMDDQVTPENAPSPLISIYCSVTKLEKDKTENKVDALKDAPFAKFKNYNSHNGHNGHNSHSTNKNTKSSDNIKNVLEKNKLEHEYNRNKFFSLGKIVNFQFLQPVSKKHYSLNGFSSPVLDDLAEETVLQKQVLNYKDYKNSKLTRE